MFFYNCLRKIDFALEKGVKEKRVLSYTDYKHDMLIERATEKYQISSLFHYKKVKFTVEI